MKGYKFLTPEMRSSVTGRRYYLGMWYILNRVDSIRKKGFCFYESLEELLCNHKLSDGIVLECTIAGKVVKEKGKRMTNKIKLEREVSLCEIDFYLASKMYELAEHPDYRLRLQMAERGIGLAILQRDKDIRVWCVSRGLSPKAAEILWQTFRVSRWLIVMVAIILILCAIRISI